MSFALYIHWPFCKAKCPYCDFNSHVRESVDVQRWQAALLAELCTMAEWMPDARLGSIFFGGGTPSLMPPALAGALIDEAARLWPQEDAVEITLEANPTSVEASKMADFASAGINRVSLGVQSLRAENLRFLGREHSPQEALKAVELAASLFARYSFDLIYALPNQSADDWQAELEEALTFAGDHLSLYQLTIEPNTAFFHDYHVKKRFKLPKDRLARELFLLTQEVMEAAGMPAYEISNHARAGQESRHNLTYWRGGAYVGVGAGAHGRVFTSSLSLPDSFGQSIEHKQWYATHTLKSPERWLEAVEGKGTGLELCQPISETERAEEQLLTGLRLREGLLLTPPVCSLLNQPRIDFYETQGLLARRGDRLHATPEGWLVLNQLLSEILI